VCASTFKYIYIYIYIYVNYLCVYYHVYLSTKLSYFVTFIENYKITYIWILTKHEGCRQYLITAEICGQKTTSSVRNSCLDSKTTTTTKQG